MCKHGTLKEINIIRRANPFIADGWHKRHVDACIAEELQQLNEIGIITINSCCGHGKGKAATLIARESADLAKAWGYEPYEYEDHPDLMIDLVSKQ